MAATFSADLSGRVALVTGASSGLGAHFARVLARAGAAVGLAARRTDRLAALQLDIEREGGRAVSAALDVSSPGSVAQALASIEAALGQIDILVNNAGIAATVPLLDESEDQWRAVIDTNLTGAWRVAQETARRMVAGKRGGAIVNVASILALRTASRVAAYSAAKAGLVSLTRSMALELARHHIRVNALAPGYIKTDINREFLESEAGQAIARRIPQRRFGEPEDLDGPLLLLASDAGRFVTGTVVVADGGHSLAFI